MKDFVYDDSSRINLQELDVNAAAAAEIEKAALHPGGGLVDQILLCGLTLPVNQLTRLYVTRALERAVKTALAAATDEGKKGTTLASYSDTTLHAALVELTGVSGYSPWYRNFYEELLVVSEFKNVRCTIPNEAVEVNLPDPEDLRLAAGCPQGIESRLVASVGRLLEQPETLFLLKFRYNIFRHGSMRERTGGILRSALEAFLES